MRILLGAFIFGIIGIFTVVGVMTPGVGWFLYVFLIPFWAMFPIIIVGTRGALWLLGTYVVVYPIAKLILSRQPWYLKAASDLKSKGSASIGGFVMSSGSHSSGGFSSGGATRLPLVVCCEGPQPTTSVASPAVAVRSIRRVMRTRR